MIKFLFAAWPTIDTGIDVVFSLFPAFVCGKQRSSVIYSVSLCPQMHLHHHLCICKQVIQRRLGPLFLLNQLNPKGRFVCLLEGIPVGLKPPPSHPLLPLPHPAHPGLYRLEHLCAVSLLALECCQWSRMLIMVTSALLLQPSA